MRRAWLPVFFILILGLNLGWVSTFAQSGESPLVWQANNMLMRLTDAGPQPFSGCQPEELMISRLILSPDGRYFAVTIQPTILADRLQELGGVGGGALPTAVWLCDIATETGQVIAQQPDNFSFLQSDQPDSWTSYGDPVWSPDGQRLAMTTLSADIQAPGTNGIMIYNVADGTQTRFNLDASLPLVAGVPSPLFSLWGPDGIFVFLPTLDETSDFAYVEYALLYTPEGVLLAQFDITGPEGDFIIDRRLIRDTDDQVRPGLLYGTAGMWQLLNVQTGQLNIMNGLPEYYTPLLPEGVSLVEVPRVDTYTFDYLLLDPSGQFSEAPFLTGLDPRRLAISRNGQQVAVATAALDVYAGGQVQSLSDTEGFADDFNASVIWAPMAWRVQSNIP